MSQKHLNNWQSTQEVQFNEGDLTKNAKRYGDAYLSSAFTADGNALNNVETGWRPAVGNPTTAQTRAAPAPERVQQETPILDKKCDECGKMIISGQYAQLGASFYHAQCYDHRKKSGHNIQTFVVGAPKAATSSRVSDAQAEKERDALAKKINEGKEICPACNKAVGGMGVRFLDQSYHTHCIVCSKCNVSLLDKAVAVDDATQKPICSDCKLGPGAKCAGCLKPLGAGAYVDTGKHKYHPEHFNCNKCKKNLRGQPFADVEGYPWCGNCVNSKR